MLDNGAFIQKELGSIDVSDRLRGAISDVCSALMATKHDVISELIELDGLGATPEAAVVQDRVDRIFQWLSEEIPKLHELVMSLESASKEEPRHGIAYILVAESATNVLRSFGSMADALERYRDAVR